MLGLGNYLKENGYEPSSGIIEKHTEKVLETLQGNRMDSYDVERHVYHLQYPAAATMMSRPPQILQTGKSPQKAWDWYIGIITIPERLFTKTCSMSTAVFLTG